MIKHTAYRILAVLVMLFASTSYAQLFRAYLSVNGSDTNPCTLSSPCRLLPAALNAVAAGGEIWMLDSGNFNTSAVDIAKNVSILAIPGQVGSFVANGGPALSISTAGVNVKLRNVVIVGFFNGTGTDGISMTNGAALTVEDSLFSDLPYVAINAFTAAQIRVANTTFRDTGWGVYLRAGAVGNISNSRFYKMAGGGVAVAAAAGQQTSGSVSDTIVTDSGSGFTVGSSDASGAANLTAIRCTAVNNGTGFDTNSSAGGPAIMTVSYSMATKNIVGFAQRTAGTVVRSLGNNDVHGNSTDLLGTITAVSGS